MTDDRLGTARCALVTGGAVRVGAAIVRALANAGYAVAVHYHSSSDQAEGLADELRAADRRIETLQADLTDPTAPADLVASAASELGGLHLLVNSAAIFPRARPEEITAAEWDRVFALNTRAPFLCAQAASRIMESGSSVVNITDTGAEKAWPSYVSYVSSKAALASMTLSLARAWSPRIRVNAIAPGPVALPETYGPEEKAKAEARIALGRLGRPQDVGEAVVYLDRAEFVTGAVLHVDGGARLL